MKTEELTLQSSPIMLRLNIEKHISMHSYPTGRVFNFYLSASRRSTETFQEVLINSFLASASVLRYHLELQTEVPTDKLFLISG